MRYHWELGGVWDRLEEYLSGEFVELFCSLQLIWSDSMGIYKQLRRGTCIATKVSIVSLINQ